MVVVELAEDVEQAPDSVSKEKLVFSVFLDGLWLIASRAVVLGELDAEPDPADERAASRDDVAQHRDVVLVEDELLEVCLLEKVSPVAADGCVGCLGDAGRFSAPLAAGGRLVLAAFEVA